MAHFIKESAIRRAARDKGKRVGAGFLAYLDRRVANIVQQQIVALKSLKTLNLEDAEAAEKLGLVR